MAETALVTGGTGLIGSHLVRALTRSWQVEAPDRKALDLSREVDPARLPPRASAVIHLAQADEYRDFPRSAGAIFRVNTASTLALLDWARAAGVQTFVLASTGGVYGSGERAFREEDPPSIGGSEIDFYLSTRRAAELLAAPYAAYFRVVILRFFFVYGPNQAGEMLFPRLVESVRTGTPVRLPGGEGLRFNPVHVDDAVRAVERAVDLQESQIVNVAGPEVLHLKEVVQQIGEAVGKKPVLEARPGEKPRHLVADISRMTRVLVAPRVAFSEGVQSLLNR